jgi:hypothetical protein
MIEPEKEIENVNVELESENNNSEAAEESTISNEVLETSQVTEENFSDEKEGLTEDSFVSESSEVYSSPNTSLEEIHEIEEIETQQVFDEDFSSYSKKDFVDLAGRLLEAMNARSLGVSDVKNYENVMKLSRQALDDISAKEKSDAKAAYLAKNGSDEGFEFKNDNFSIRFEGIFIQFKEKRQAFYQKLEREKEDYFEIKTRLLQSLREIVESEEKGEGKGSWDKFKTLQTDWKNAGNINSPHNGTLWSTYNALVDRYFDIRSIQNELKDLDRKKNIIAKEGVVIKIEAIAEGLKETPLTNVVLKKSNDLLNEYKSIGPGIREEQDALWTRLKAAFDVIYDKKRELASENQTLQDDTYNAKNIILEKLKAYLGFSSESINEWNAKTKEVMEIQDQWQSIKGPMPRDKGKDISKEFWADLKLFFKHKSEFFGKLEEKKESNLKAKEELCIKAEAILELNDLSAVNTNQIIDLQKSWRTIGQVPDKFKDSLYNRFKTACDKYFDLKRDEGKIQDKEYENNLAAKLAIIEQIEKEVADGEVSFDKIAEYKKAFNAIGFVPKKNMADIQQRFVKAINSVVKASSGVNPKDKERFMLQNEAEMVNGAGMPSKNIEKQEGDIKRKIKALEEEITLTKNNLEFFGFSKNAEKLKEEYMKKVYKSEAELKELKDKLKLIKTA